MSYKNAFASGVPYIIFYSFSSSSSILNLAKCRYKKTVGSFALNILIKGFKKALQSFIFSDQSRFFKKTNKRTTEVSTIMRQLGCPTFF